MASNTSGRPLKVGTEEKMDPAEVAKIGYKAMQDGEAEPGTAQKA
jgi:hypothetical protein